MIRVLDLLDLIHELDEKRRVQPHFDFIGAHLAHVALAEAARELRLKVLTIASYISGEFLNGGRI